MEKYSLFVLLALITEIVGTISGFGSSILFVPMASLFFDFKTVLGITAVFHVFSNFTKITLFRKGVDKNIVVKLGLPAIMFVIMGAYITTKIPTQQIELLMNLMLIFVSIYLLVNFNKTLVQSNKNLIMGGITSGFLAGITGTGGAIRGIVLSAFHLSKDVFIATSALIDLGVDFSRAIIYIANGYFSNEFIFLLPFLALVSILGNLIGKKFLQKTSEKVFRYIVLGVIILTAIFQLYNYFC